MRALVVSDDPLVGDKLRAVLLRCGFQCRPQDVVGLESAAVCAGRARRVLTIFHLTRDRSDALAALRELRSTTASVIFAVGPAQDPKFILRVLREGANEYLDESELEHEVGSALVQLKARRLPQESEGLVVGVLSPSGGSGSSTLAANLSVALAKRRNDVGLFDLRLTAGDQSVLLDLKPNHTLADVCRHYDRMDQSMFRQSLVSHPCGVHLLAAPKNLEQVAQVTPQGVRLAVSTARSLFPFVVMDLDRSFGSEQLAAILQCDLLLLPLRLDMTSLRNAQRVLEYLEQMGLGDDRIRIVASRYGQPKELSARRAEAALGIQVAHYLPDDSAAVNLATNKGIPVVLERPRAKFSHSVQKLAADLDQFQDRRLHPDSESNGRSRCVWPLATSAAV